MKNNNTSNFGSPFGSGKMAFEVGSIHLFADVVAPGLVENEMNISKLFIISICYKRITVIKQEPLVNCNLKCIF